jgi:hypothetical protein
VNLLVVLGVLDDGRGRRGGLYKPFRIYGVLLLKLLLVRGALYRQPLGALSTPGFHSKCCHRASLLVQADRTPVSK